jgi:3-methylfumaryl-CoA hydratase
VREEQDLVYRQDPDPAAPRPVPPVARTDADVTETAGFTSTLLFRYSALTMNGHRIHYDADYTKVVEGYAGLVTHGPLLAQLLMRLAERQGGPLRGFAFKATAPVTVDEAVTLNWRADGAMWVAGADGRQCMEAVAS